MNILTCGTTVNNVAKTQCRVNYGMPNRAFLSFVKKSYSYANALLEATWTTDINLAASSRLYILPPAHDVTNEIEEATIKDGNLLRRYKIRDGREAITFMYENVKDCFVKDLKTFDGMAMYAFLCTESDAIIGGDDGSNLVQVPVDVVVTDYKLPENKDGAYSCAVTLYFRNTKGNKDLFILPNDGNYNTGTLWSPNDLDGIVDVEMTEVSASGTEIVVDVTAECDGREITGLVTADFQVLASNGSSVSVTVTASNNRYTLAGTFAADTYSISLKNQPDMTTKGYETQSTLSVTVS